MSANVDLWAAHFGFSATPFTKAVPADKLFSRRAHAEAVARSRYCIAESALGVVTGDVGAGKTVALRAAVASLDRTRYTVVYLANPSGGPKELYVAMNSALGATRRFHKAEAINEVVSLLAQEDAERHRKVVFAIGLCRPRDYADLRRTAGVNVLRREGLWRGAFSCCRHNHRLSRKANMGSAGR